jgi:hypothetical protein
LVRAKDTPGHQDRHGQAFLHAQARWLSQLGYVATLRGGWYVTQLADRANLKEERVQIV